MKNDQNIARQVEKLIEKQIKDWPLAAQNYAALKNVKSKTFQFNDFQVIVQHNPARIKSSAAKTDFVSIKNRPCFLCDKNRPKEQLSVDFLGKYSILVNPYPIFPKHLTIALKEHCPQKIKLFFADMLELSKSLPDFTIFYNGSKCGASAPDHFHFQAGSRDFMPIDYEVSLLISNNAKLLKEHEGVSIYAVANGYLRNLLVLTSFSMEKLNDIFLEILEKLNEVDEIYEEPMINVLVSFVKGEWHVILFPREKQRPLQYYAEGENQILISPASVELGGVVVLPRKEDFIKIKENDLVDVYHQVSIDGTKFEKILPCLRV